MIFTQFCHVRTGCKNCHRKYNPSWVSCFDPRLIWLDIKVMISIINMPSKYQLWIHLLLKKNLVALKTQWLILRLVPQVMKYFSPGDWVIRHWKFLFEHVKTSLWGKYFNDISNSVLTKRWSCWFISCLFWICFWDREIWINSNIFYDNLP